MGYGFLFCSLEPSISTLLHGAPYSDPSLSFPLHKKLTADQDAALSTPLTIHDFCYDNPLALHATVFMFRGMDRAFEKFKINISVHTERDQKGHLTEMHRIIQEQCY